MSVLTGVSLVTALIGALLVALAVWAGKRRRLLHSLVSVLSALLCLALAGLFAAVTIGIHGYRALPPRRSRRSCRPSRWDRSTSAPR
jgi:hypothetical protein